MDTYKFYYKIWFICLMIVIFWPVGLFLLYQRYRFDKSFKEYHKQIQDIASRIILPHAELTDKQKVDLKKSIEPEKNSNNPKFHRTEKEEDLSFNFSQKYSDIISLHENDIYNKCGIAATTNSLNIDIIISLHEEAVNCFYNFKDFCLNKSKGGQIYFEDMWLYCHNSKNECFSYISDIESVLSELKSNYNDNLAYYSALTDVKNKLEVMLGENSFLFQNELYKKFKPLKAIDIKRVIRNLKDEKYVLIEKYGSTYKIQKTKS